MAIYQNYPAELFSNFREMLHTSAQKYGNKTFVRQKENGVWHSYTFARFFNDVRALATALMFDGANPKKVLLAGAGGYRWAVVYMAVTCSGNIIVPLDKNIRADELAKIASFCEADAIFYDGDPQNAPKDIPLYRFADIPEQIRSGKNRIANRDAAYSNTTINGDALSVLLFSAEQTNPPRAVMLSQYNICFDLREMCQMIFIGENDVFLSVLPLHHAYACTCGLLCALYRGSSIAFCEDVHNIWKDMRRVRATVLLGVPVMTKALLHRLQSIVQASGTESSTQTALAASALLPTQRARMLARQKLLANLLYSAVGELRLVISGGSAADPDVLKALREFGIDAYQGYGISECSPLIALHREHCYNDASVGMATPNTLLDVCDVQEDGIGEIRCRGKQVMLGYYQNPELTAQVLHGGWFYTGDLGYLDDNGYLYVMGKRSNVIVNAQGNPIFPEELEGLLCKTPFVKEAVVVSFWNDSRQDADIVALVYPNRDALRDRFGDACDEQKLHIQIKKALSTVNATVPTYKHIHHYLLRDTAFPKTPARKIRRVGLCEAAKDEYLKLMK